MIVEPFLPFIFGLQILYRTRKSLVSFLEQFHLEDMFFQEFDEDQLMNVSD